MVGVAAGVLIIGTVGFIVLGVMVLKGKIAPGGKAGATTQNAPVAAAPPNQQPTPAAVPKTSRPKAELFVMSYCPYGLQMEKAYLPVMSLLREKADLEIKFVSYAMHGLKEIEENTRQYCIAAEQSDKHIAYMNCFTMKDDYQGCLTVAKINQSKLNSCVAATNKKFGVMEKYNDQSTWLSGQFPLYPVHQDLNAQYNVQGSPTLIINGVEVQTARSPEAVKKAVCDAFEKAPAECGRALEANQASPSFGAGDGHKTGDATCG